MSEAVGQRQSEAFIQADVDKSGTLSVDEAINHVNAMSDGEPIDTETLTDLGIDPTGDLSDADLGQLLDFAGVPPPPGEGGKKGGCEGGDCNKGAEGSGEKDAGNAGDAPMSLEEFLAYLSEQLGEEVTEADLEALGIDLSDGLSQEEMDIAMESLGVQPPPTEPTTD